jgi:hypothetical protein
LRSSLFRPDADAYSLIKVFYAGTNSQFIGIHGAGVVGRPGFYGVRAFHFPDDQVFRVVGREAVDAARQPAGDIAGKCADFGHVDLLLPLQEILFHSGVHIKAYVPDGLAVDGAHGVSVAAWRFESVVGNVVGHEDIVCHPAAPGDVADNLRTGGVGGVLLVLAVEGATGRVTAADEPVGIGLKELGAGDFVEVEVFGSALNAAVPSGRVETGLKQVRHVPGIAPLNDLIFHVVGDVTPNDVESWCVSHDLLLKNDVSKGIRTPDPLLAKPSASNPPWDSLSLG